MHSGTRIATALLALSVVLGGWGCQSLTSPASARFASVKIGGHTLDEVRATTITVFENDGYQTVTEGAELVFEREGSQWDQVAYGDNIGDGTVVNRVRAQVIDLGGGVCRVQCTAYVVRDAGSSTEDEVRLHAPRSGHYRDLLDQVVQRLTVVTTGKL